MPGLAVTTLLAVVLTAELAAPPPPAASPTPAPAVSPPPAAAPTPASPTPTTSAEFGDHKPVPPKKKVVHRAPAVAPPRAPLPEPPKPNGAWLGIGAAAGLTATGAHLLAVRAYEGGAVDCHPSSGRACGQYLRLAPFVTWGVLQWTWSRWTGAAGRRRGWNDARRWTRPAGLAILSGTAAVGGIVALGLGAGFRYSDEAEATRRCDGVDTTGARIAGWREPECIGSDLARAQLWSIAGAWSAAALLQIPVWVSSYDEYFVLPLTTTPATIAAPDASFDPTRALAAHGVALAGRF